MSDALEYDEVRKVSAEIAGRFAPSLATHKLKHQFKMFIEQQEFILAKVYLYALCGHLVLYERKAEMTDLTHTLFGALAMKCPPPTAQGTCKHNQL